MWWGNIEWFKIEYKSEAFAIMAGFGLAGALNMSTQRPINAGVYKHVLFGVGLMYCSKIIFAYADHRNRRRQAILNEYIKLHPEDFIEPPRKLMRDEFDDYIPIR